MGLITFCVRSELATAACMYLLPFNNLLTLAGSTRKLSGIIIFNDRNFIGFSAVLASDSILRRRSPNRIEQMLEEARFGLNHLFDSRMPAMRAESIAYTKGVINCPGIPPKATFMRSYTRMLLSGFQRQ